MGIFNNNEIIQLKTQHLKEQAHFANDLLQGLTSILENYTANEETFRDLVNEYLRISETMLKENNNKENLLLVEFAEKLVAFAKASSQTYNAFLQVNTDLMVQTEELIDKYDQAAR